MKLLQEAISQEYVRPLFQEVRLGLEKESQRVTLDGQLARTNHPKKLGNRSFHPSIQTDFSETQIELITPVANSAKDVLKYLAAFHEVALRSMPDNEMLWPLSMPPVLPEKDEDIRIAKLDKFEEVLYRRYLAKTYGKRKQMVSGIHYNFEFSPEFIEELFANQTEYQTIEELRTFIYVKVARNYLRYRWLITYLLGATPVSEEGYFEPGTATPNEPVRSIRNSQYGYTNHPEVKTSFETIEEYVHGIERLVELGILSEEKEFYAPVRLRGGKKVSDLKAHGVNYIEVRNIDINPFATYGINEREIRLIQLFLMYMLWVDEKGVSAEELVQTGETLNNQVALENPLSQTEQLAEGIHLIEGLRAMAERVKLSQEDFELITEMEELLANPEETISGQMVLATQAGKTNQQLAVEIGLKNYQSAHEKPYQIAGFRGMELSTQIFLFDAIQKGLQVEVLDENDQFLKLKHQKHVEYVKNANMTSKDSYIVPLAMENKTVTKKILDKAGFRVPKGKEFQTIEQALNSYDYFAGKGIVIKPKSTNYGIGITIFKDGASREAYQAGLQLAFKEDSDVLVEEFLAGTEYRFFVCDGKVRAILLRIPANVVGDGERTIAELVAAKNDNPLRGTNHRAPLELIQLGELEALMLQGQGLEFSSIPAEGQIAYLRENSNISTGGDSIDITDDFDESYKKIAVDAVKALGATICGIDLIIPDKTREGRQNDDSYGIIEGNFNPAMHMHVYPYAGAGQRLTMDVLRLLYPEIVK